MRRIKIKKEDWSLRINQKEVLRIRTLHKRERNILDIIRKTLKDNFKEEQINLTNRIDRSERVLRLNSNEVTRLKNINTYANKK